MSAFIHEKDPAQEAKAASPVRPGRAFSGQGHAAGSILGLQHTIGNHAVQQLLRDGPQMKPAVNAPGDRYEQEAEHVADRVVHQPDARVQEECGCGGGGGSRGEAEQARRGRKYLQTKSAPAQGRGESAAPAGVQEVLRTPGQPLDATTRAFMEPRFGRDLGDVRTHSDAPAADSAQALQARAYTVGPHIAFGAGQFAPATQPGQRLLAHELTHVLQQASAQGSNGGPALIQRDPDPPKGQTPTLPKKIIHGSTKLSRETQNYAANNRIASGTNLIAVEYSVGGGERQTRVFENRSGIAHTEEIMEQYFRDLRKSVTVYEVYSERQPCGFSEHNCEKLLRGERYKDAKVTFGYNYQETLSPAPQSRAAKSRDLIDAHHERVYQTKQLEWDFIGKDPPAHFEVNDPGRPSKRPRRLGDRGGTGTPAVQGGAVADVGAMTPSARGQAKSALAEVGAQVLLSLQLDSVRSAERAKAEARFQQLLPEIERLLAEGNSVTVTVEVEAPRQVDIAAAIAGVGDPSQVVYYRDMYIKWAMPRVRPSRAGDPPRMNAVPEIREGFGDPRRWDDPHELTLDQQIRLQMGDPDPAKKHQPRNSSLRIVTRDRVFTPPELTSPVIVQPRPQAPAAKPKPRLDEAAKQKLAAAPSRVYLLSANVIQYKTAVEIEKRLAGHPTLVFAKEYTGGFPLSSRTRVTYFSDLDKARAEALAEIVRAAGVPSCLAERVRRGGDPDDDTPGVLQIFFGRDAEK